MGLTLLVTALGIGSASSQGASPPITPMPAGADPWLDQINWWRSLGGATDGTAIASVTNQAADNIGPTNHVNYLASIWAAGSTYCGHGEDPAYPKSPSVDYSHNVLFCGPTSLSDAVDGWMNTPFHGPPILSPGVSRVGAGLSSYQDRTANAALTAASVPISKTFTWPKANGVLPRTHMMIGESPDPTTICPPLAGQSPGQSVYAWYPSDRIYVAATITDDDGAVPFCVLRHDAWATTPLAVGDMDNQFTFFAKRAYNIGSAVTVSLTTQAASGGNNLTLTWSFQVVDLPQGQLGSAQGRSGAVDVTLNPLTGTQDGGTPLLERELWLSPTTNALSPSIKLALPIAGSARVKVTSGTYWYCIAAENAVGWSACPSWRYVSVGPSPTTPTVPGSFNPLQPQRLFDSRPDQQQGAITIVKQSYGANNILHVNLSGTAGLPTTGVTAVSLNVTVVNPTGPGFLTVYPCGTIPTASNLNFTTGQTVPNAVIAPLSSTGDLCFYANTNTDIVADINGWFPTRADN